MRHYDSLWRMKRYFSPNSAENEPTATTNEPTKTMSEPGWATNEPDFRERTLSCAAVA